MGKWSQKAFGKEDIGSIGFALGGTAKQKYENQVISLFDEQLSFGNVVAHNYVLSKNNLPYAVSFNLYGAPLMIDTLSEMYDGGVRNVIFIGYAYAGFQASNYEIGSVVVPTVSHHFDGSYAVLDPNKKVAHPDTSLRNKIIDVLKTHNINHYEGPNISVPAVTFQLPHDNDAYKSIKPVTVEMELASCLSRAQDLGMRAAGILIVSDNRKKAIGERPKEKYESKIEVIETLVQHLDDLDLEPLPNQTFKVSEYLANIIHDPEDETNIYKED